MDEKNRTILVPVPKSVLKTVMSPILLFTIIVYGIMIYYNPYPVMFVMLMIVLALFIWITFFHGRADYEYTLLENTFCIELISKKGKRRGRKEYAWKDVILFARSKDEIISNYVGKGKKAKLRDYASRTHAEREYVLLFEVDGKRELLLVELTDEQMKDVISFVPDKMVHLPKETKK